MPAELISCARRAMPSTNVLRVGSYSSATSYDKLHACLSDGGRGAPLLISNLAMKDGWTLVQYFSARECETSLSNCDGRMLDGRIITVRRFSSAAPAASASAEPMPLRNSEAIALMNHFLGPTRWSHSVLSKHRVEWKPGAARAEYVARVRVCVDGEALLEADGTGITEEATVADGSGLGRAIKAAVTNALRTALASVVIVRLESGVTVARAVVGASTPACGAGQPRPPLQPLIVD
jgi:hypothetical protein